MDRSSTAARHLTQGEQRALASFLAGRLPAGQLHGELCRARESALAQAARPAAAPAAAPAPALHAA
jgi:phage terminase large subunit-like protein